MEISPLLTPFLRPMSAATAALLKAPGPYDLHDTDRLHISLLKQKGESKKFIFHAFSSEPERLASNYSNLRWWDRIPGASTRHGETVAPITDVTVLCTLAVWHRDKLTFADDEAKMEFWTRLGEFMALSRIADFHAGWKQDRIVPDGAPEGTPGFPPMSHQRVAAHCMLESPIGISAFMEMRTGKTYAFIMAMDEDCAENTNAMNLVVCPKNIRTNWVRELKTFSKRNINVVVLRGSKIRRMKALLTAFEFRKDYDYTVVICSYDGLSKTTTQIATFSWRWAALDESHKIKQARTDRWQACLVLRPQCEKRICLTGTPILNHPFDLYTQLEWMQEGFSGFSTYEEFRKFYGKFKTVGRGYEKLVGLQNLALLQERLARGAFLVSKAEALPDLPPVTHSVRECEMSAMQKQVYADVAMKLFAEIESELEGEKSSMTINNILTKLLRLSQVTAGFAAIDGEINIDTGEVVSRELVHFNENPKLDELVEWIKERREENHGLAHKSIVWCCWIPALNKIRERFDAEGIKYVWAYGKIKEGDRDAARDAFNTDPTIEVFLGNPSSGGEGINLNGRCDDSEGNRRAQCDAIAYFAQGWSSGVRRQSEARPQDKFCEWPIEIVDFIVPDTIDYTIADRVLGKIEQAMQVQDIRGILKELTIPKEAA